MTSWPRAISPNGRRQELASSRSLLDVRSLLSDESSDESADEASRDRSTGMSAKEGKAASRNERTARLECDNAQCDGVNFPKRVRSSSYCSTRGSPRVERFKSRSR